MSTVFDMKASGKDNMPTGKN